MLLERREALTSDVLDEAADALAARGLQACAGSDCVALYLSFGAEPPTWELADALRRAGTDVLTPVVEAARVLEWVRYEGRDGLLTNDFGIPEPTGVRLGPAALARADVVLVPGLAVDGAGHRLGRGGGFYDRALARVGTDQRRLIVLHDHEVLDTVPHEPHDQPVHGALTPARVLDLGADVVG